MIAARLALVHTLEFDRRQGMVSDRAISYLPARSPENIAGNMQDTIGISGHDRLCLIGGFR